MTWNGYSRSSDCDNEGRLIVRARIPRRAKTFIARNKNGREISRLSLDQRSGAFFGSALAATALTFSAATGCEPLDDRIQQVRLR